MNKTLWIIIILVILAALGYGIYRYQGNVTSTTVQPTTTTTNSTPTVPSSNQNDTATWKTYHNDKYGLEFKYPAEFTISPDSYNNLLIKDTNIIPDRFFNGILTIGPLRVREGATFEIFVHNDAKYNSFKNFDYSDEHIESINGITVYRYTKATGPRSEKNAFFVLNRNHGVSASYMNAPGDLTQTEREFETILSTFKFTNFTK